VPVEDLPLARVLALAIGPGTPEVAALRLLEDATGLERLACATPFELDAWLEERELDPLDRAGASGRRRRPGTRGRATALAAAFELGRRVERARGDARPALSSAGDVAAWATPRLVALAHEELWLLALDGRGHLRGARCIARGGLHGAAVRAVDPLRAALRLDASAFVLVHNHPSGDPSPSREDVLLTAHVADAAAIVGLALLDHVVVARGGFACVPLPDGRSRQRASPAAAGASEAEERPG
jgi:DNA repair protein RadC